MGRKRVSKGQIIIKKEEKLPKIASIMDVGFTDDEYVETFKKLYSKYWNNIVKRYNEHEKLNKPGKGHPMPEPRKYLLNVSKKYLEEIRQKHKDGWIISEEEKNRILNEIEKENRVKKKQD